MKKKSINLLYFVIVSLLFVHASLSFFANFAKSPTFDETVHLTGGYTFWKLNDYRINPENGNFPQRWVAIPILINKKINIPLDSPHWHNVNQWSFSYYFLFKSGNDPDELFIPAGFMMSLLSILLCLCVFYISYESFGIKGGIISLSLIAFCPNLLAHSNIVASDLCSALFFTTSSYFVWKNLLKVSIKNLLLSSLSLAFLFLSKMSAPIIIPVYLILILLVLRDNYSITIQLNNSSFSLINKIQKLKAIVLIILLQAIFVYTAIWASYGFRFNSISDGEKAAGALAIQYDELLPPQDAIEKTIVAIDKFQLLPHAYLQGYLYVKKHLTKRLAFLNGKKSSTGFISFFPFAFIVKTPIPSIILIAFSLLILFSRQVNFPRSLIGLAIFAILYILLALNSTINIGHRHLLPVYPLLFILCGSVAKFCAEIRTTKPFFLASACIIWLAIETISISPHFLAYFNQFVGGPKNAYKHLVDSSLDWGQDLKTLAELRGKLDPMKKENFYLSYFGSVSINSYGLNDFISLPGYFAQENFCIHEYEEGYYCVSATMLHLLYYPDIFGTFKFPPDILFNDSFQQLQPFIDELFSAQRKGQSALEQFLKENDEEFCMRRYRAYDLIRFAKLCEYLKKRTPDYYAGYSILIYKLNKNEIQQAMLSNVVF